MWDLLALGDADLRETLAVRRARLERALARRRRTVHLSPATRDRARAADWFRRFEGAGLDGVVAKRLDGLYEPGERAMFKVKHERTADCVVAGFRWEKSGKGTRVGSLLLGLYDDDGILHHVGVAAAFTEARREDAGRELAPLREGARADDPWLDWEDAQEWRGRRGSACPGATSRWNRGKDLSCEPLRLERCARSRTTTCRGRASAMPRTSCAAARTSARSTAATTSSRSRPPPRPAA